ncbi:MAG: hypothetical protein RIS88_1380 [Pseudomonadota bacterium]|jgi:hypothetical protein
MPRDPSLASNLFTACVPRPDQFFADGLTYLGSHATAAARILGKDLREACATLGGCRRQTRVAPLPQRSVGDAPRMTDPWHGQAGVGAVRAVEGPSGLPAEWVDDIEAYGATLHAAGGLTPPPETAAAYERLRLRDAFPQMHSLVKSDPIPLLPQAVLNSSLVTPATDSDEVPRALFDPLSGFVAGISLRAPARGDKTHAGEVIISFSGMGSRGATLGQGIRCFLNVLGLTPPKNFQQAAKLTRMVHAHLHQLNQVRVQLGLPLFRLTVCGHSMGGALATFAALRLPPASVDAFPVKTVAINPLRLGLLCRARIGREAMQQAEDRVTAVTVQGDWVARWTTLHSAPIGKGYVIPVAPCSTVRSRHNHFVEAAREYRDEVGWEHDRALRKHG